MKKKLLLLLSSLMILSSCSLFNRLKPSSSSSSVLSSSESSGTSGTTSSSSSTPTSSGSEDDNFDDDTSGKSISLNKQSLILKTTKYEYLSVNFFPSVDDFNDETKEGTWTTSDPSIATVSQVGKVTAVAKGTAVICYTTTVDQLKGYCTVTVVDSLDNIKREYVKVTDMDSIAVGDQIVFGCPDFGVAASLDRLSGYLKFTSTSFSDGGTKISNLGDGAGEFYVGQGDGESFTLESQEGKYLAGKKTDRSGGLLFVNDKGQKNWSFERVSGSDYCHNYDIDWGWLMFNKINNSDIRFNLYESNETALMKLPTIYRLTITEIS